MTPASPYPPSVAALIERFARLPGIGLRSAERLAYFILTSPKDEAMGLAVALRDVKKNIRACTRCFHVAEADLCTICADPRRDPSLLCVVELPRDIIALEKTGAWRGLYHCLQGHLSPADNIGPDELRIDELLARIVAEGSPVEEVVLGLNPSTEGDATASWLTQELRRVAPHLRLTRFARGLASGTDLESTSPSSLHFAIEGRALVEPARPESSSTG